MGLGNKVLNPIVVEPDESDLLHDDPLEVMEADLPVAKRLKPFQVAMLIAEECGLAEKLEHSVCLCCKNRVMVQSASRTVTLYCQALNRDLDISITRCTSFLQG